MIRISTVPEKVYRDIIEVLGKNSVKQAIIDATIDESRTVTFSLGDNVIFKTYTTGEIVLDLGGNIFTIDRDEYLHVLIQ